MISAKAPGKLFIAGEYAIVNPGNSAVLIAVDRFIHVHITESVATQGRIHSAAYENGSLSWERTENGIQAVSDTSDYAISAIKIVEEYRQAKHIRPLMYDISITSELNDTNGQKLGLGSSGAVVVAIIDALNKLYSLGLNPSERYKLGIIATCALSPKASGGDIATSTFGGWIHYSSPDRTQVLADYVSDGVLAALASNGWESSVIIKLPEPTDLSVIVGWTGSPVSTDEMVEKAGAVCKQRAIEEINFVSRSEQIVTELTHGIIENNSEEILESISTARELLQNLDAKIGNIIETPKIKDICDRAETRGAVAKPSGAGGGDCAIMLADKYCDVLGLYRDFKDLDVLRLQIAVAPNIEEFYDPA